ncbi:MAG: signal peptide peptidase SppA [Calditrichia bacterium]
MSGKTKAILIVSFIGLFLIGFYLTLKSSLQLNQGNVNIKSNSILKINLSGELKDRSGRQPSLLGESKPQSLQMIKQALQNAAKDDRIEAVVIEPNLLTGVGFGKIQELAKIIEEFKATSIKPIYAYIEFCFPKEYYLATYCDSIFAVPTGSILLNGLAGSSYYLKEGLDKLGIQADFIAIGKYKNAPEMFTRKNFSEDQKEVLNDLLDAYYDDFMTTISKNRNLSKDELTGIVNRGFFSSEKAKILKLVDQLYYPQELEEKFGEKASVLDVNQYTKATEDQFTIKSSNKIAIVYAQGTIYSGKGDLENDIYAVSFVKMIDKIKSNKSIKGVVLRINSPGGSGTASEIMWHSLMQLKESKPLVVSVSDMAASGGYYLAMTGDSIFAMPGSIVGSIGVFAGKFSLGGLYSKLGINKETLTRGKNALMFDEERPFSPSEREVLMENLEAFYTTFVQKVADSRKKSWDEIHRVAQGRVWTAQTALQHGLFDRIGDLDDAVNCVKNMAGLSEDDPVQEVIYPHYKPFFEKLFEKLQSDDGIPVKMLAGEESNIIIRYFFAFTNFRSYEPIAMLPFYLELK